MLLYIEFFSRLPGVSLETFHYVAGRAGAWSGEYGADHLLLNLGRTFRTGPEPEYFAVWYTPDFGLERIAVWEQAFSNREADQFEVPFKLAARIDRAGCYEALLEPKAGKDGLYYTEYLESGAGAASDEIAHHYADRRDRHEGLELNLVCLRIGHLGPDPRGLAVWNVGGWDRLEPVVRELDAVEKPVRLVTAGLYRDLGQETL